MKRAKWLEETRLMRFEEAHEDWTDRRLTRKRRHSLLTQIVSPHLRNAQGP